MTSVRTRNGRTVAALVGVIAVMGGLVVAAVPLYDWFCRTTGYGGTTQKADAAPQKILQRTVTVRFNADVNSHLPWSFTPAQREIKLRLGESAMASYNARNLDRAPVTGSATFNVTPAKAGPYFNKIACFCFTRQTLKPGESVNMPVTFFVDPALAEDRNLDDITTITLSYTFFRAKGDDPRKKTARTAAPARSLTTLN